jgi:hypothetical protein
VSSQLMASFSIFGDTNFKISTPFPIWSREKTLAERHILRLRLGDRALRIAVVGLISVVLLQGPVILPTSLSDTVVFEVSHKRLLFLWFMAGKPTSSARSSLRHWYKASDRYQNLSNLEAKRKSMQETSNTRPGRFFPKTSTGE